jgi:hypothetical protein
MSNRYNRAKIVTNEQNTKLALIFYCECRIFSNFSSKIPIIDNLLHYSGGKFYIFYIIYNKKRAKEAVCAILAEYRLFLLRFSVFT